jgi:hypothetical protein
MCFRSALAHSVETNSPVRFDALVGRFKFSSTIYSKKHCLFSRHFSLKKLGRFSKLFHPFSTFFCSNWKSGENVLGFPPSFWLKIDGKRTRFFTGNSAEKLEFPNQ